MTDSYVLNSSSYAACHSEPCPEQSEGEVKNLPIYIERFFKVSRVANDSTIYLGLSSYE